MPTVLIDYGGHTDKTGRRMIKTFTLDLVKTDVDFDDFVDYNIIYPARFKGDLERRTTFTLVLLSNSSLFLAKDQCCIMY